MKEKSIKISYGVLKLTDNAHKRASESSLQGYIAGIKLKDITTVLGQSTAIQPHESTESWRREWVIERKFHNYLDSELTQIGNSRDIKTSNIATLYDWKERDKPIDEVTVWNIGGHYKSCLDIISDLFKDYKCEIKDSIYGSKWHIMNEFYDTSEKTKEIKDWRNDE